ncbi:HTH domain-containing protein [Pyxidicoccus fallax]|uniref:HTH domain-containing protein n=1 Tax=Pyxidicoccus fallax TaxID=394095 RepID=UPI001FECE6FF|nr:restriction endonuclease [Pyxidicoccus fallax]
MTFYEAALRVLESEGRPLHFLEITEKSIQQNLLSHIGKTPEVTMLSRLAAMARRTRDRKVIVTAKDTFALVDWSIPEDAEALAQTGVMEPHPEEDLPPLRPAERHPEPRQDNVKVAGRGSDRKRRRDEEDERGRRKRFPPLPEVVFEILSEAEVALRTEHIIERARGKELCAEETTVEAVLTALLEDNQRRIDAGRRPQYSFNKESGEVSLERAGAPSEAPPLELQAAFAQALGIPLEGGRPQLGKPSAAAAAEPVVDAALLTTLRTTLKDARRAVARGLRKRLGELDVGTFEKSVVKMMHGLGFRELKVAKRSKEGPLLTARKREGSVELRYAVRMLKGAPAIDRKNVQELRRDLGHYSAQVGLLVSAGDVRGDARTEAQASGSLVMLWCGDALGEKFLEAKTGVSVTTVELYEVEERFFEAAKLDAEEAQKRREERQREKQARGEGGEEASAETAAAPERERPREKRRREREEREAREARETEEGTEVSEAAEATSATVPSEAREGQPTPPAASVQQTGEEDEEGDDEEGDDEDLEAATAFVGGARPEGAAAEGGAEGAQGERKRRRRRRRGRRGRGNRAGEAGAAPGATPAGEGAAAPGVTPAAEGAAVAPNAEATSAEGTAPAAEGATVTEATPAGEEVAATGTAPAAEGAAVAPNVEATAAPATETATTAAESTPAGEATPVQAATPAEAAAPESQEVGEARERKETPPAPGSSEGSEG